MSNIDTIDNFGLPFFGKFLISVNINGIQIFPQNSDTFKGGQTVIKSMKITESLFSPIVAGSITILDINYISASISVVEPSTITVVFIPNIPNNDSITFRGMITQSVIINDDAAKTTDMNFDQQYRILQLDFMNQDMFLANQKIPWKIPNNENDQSDFVGWIAKS